jgi:hypothetical protein
MKFVDYFLYITFRFAHNKLKKSESDSKWSAFLHTSVYMTVFIDSLVCISGLFCENPISMLLKSSSLIFVMITGGVIIPLLLSIRYYRVSGVSHIEQSYLSLNTTQQKIINSLIYIIMIGLPLLCFAVFRLYVIGHIRWWE